MTKQYFDLLKNGIALKNYKMIKFAAGDLHSKPDAQVVKLPLVVAIIFVFLLCYLFSPRWETNDDVAMSMIAHGYGIAAVGSPDLVFSNVLWGFLVRCIPELNGILGYSIATLIVLGVSGVIILYGFKRSNLDWKMALFALVLVLGRPVLFPQFTINAGLFAIGAIICWKIYAKENSLFSLIIGCALAFFSYLIRSQEFFLVLIVAFPVLSVAPLLRRRAAQVAVIILALLLLSASFIDWSAYQGADWKSFNELNLARRPFTDFEAGETLKNRPDILDKYKYSPNDIDLVATWFFVDKQVANPQSLKAAVSEVGAIPSVNHSFSNAWIGIKALWQPEILPVIWGAILITAIWPSWRRVTSWGIFVSAIFIFGFMGRPGVSRVYVPLIALLLIVALLDRDASLWRRRLGLAVLVTSAVINMTFVANESRMSQNTTDRLERAFVNFPKEPVVIWGGVFPFEYIYPVLGTSSPAMSYRFYALGVFTIAPFSVSYEEQRAGRGLVDRLISKDGVPVVANEQRFNYLKLYCQQRLNGTLGIVSEQHLDTVIISRRRCETNN